MNPVIIRNQRVLGLIGLFPPIWLAGTMYMLMAGKPSQQDPLGAALTVGLALIWPIVFIRGGIA